MFVIVDGEKVGTRFLLARFGRHPVTGDSVGVYRGSRVSMVSIPLDDVVSAQVGSYFGCAFCFGPLLLLQMLLLPLLLQTWLCNIGSITTFWSQSIVGPDGLRVREA